jgi:hypothetical protein
VTFPKAVTSTVRHVSDFVRELMPSLRQQMSREEIALAIHLRGNEKLKNDLINLINTRISGRAKVQEPSDPIVCKSMLARDRELQWLIIRLEFIYRSPVNTPGSDAELLE